MNLKNRALVGLAAATLALGAVNGASAATFSTSRAVPVDAAPAAAPRYARASLRLDIGHGKAWLGQSLPVTLRAYFRDVEGVTLEGAPELTSEGIFTSSLGHEPRQTTEMVDGEPVLVATWTGTLTPSTAGPLALAARLPARIRYRDAAPAVARRAPDEDMMEALRSGDFDTSAFGRLFEDVAPVGRMHEEAATLRASAAPLDVLPLPAADQPATFRGAVGRYDLQASLSSTNARVSEPLTLKVVVDGDGDLDRVDLAGEKTSEDWKAYPMNAKTEPNPSGKATHRKVFEQVLVPLREGVRSIPPLSLASFDPKAGRYETRSTNPLTVNVDAAPATAASDAVATPAPTDSASPAVPALAPPITLRPVKVVAWTAPAVLLLAVAALLTWAQRRRVAGARRQEMRRAAVGGRVIPFYRAAHDLIEARLAAQWNVAPEEVTVDLIHQRLGPVGDLFARTLAAEEALRFGRAQLGATDLLPLCSSLERSLSSLDSRGGLS